MSPALHRTLVLVLSALAATAALDAQARSSGGHGGGGHWNGGGHWHHGGYSHVHWGVGVGIGFGGWWPYGYPAYGYYPYGYGWAPGYAVVEQPVVVDNPVPVAPPPAYTGKNGQSAAQMETDHRQCDREAMASPAAMADASIFHRVVQVCMENHGYAIH